MPWLPDYTRRMGLPINYGTTLYDYQMKLRVNKYFSEGVPGIWLNGHCRDDFADVRFTGPDQVNPLSYWIESIVPGSYMIVWIKVPQITGGTTTPVYVYYDNPPISTYDSNGPNTFFVYDHFDGTTLSPAWDTTGFSTSVSNSILTVWNGDYGGIIWKSTQFNNVAIEARMKSSGTNPVIGLIGRKNTSNGDDFTNMVLASYGVSSGAFGRHNIRMAYYLGNAPPIVLGSAQYPNDTWRRQKLFMYSSTYTSEVYDDSNNLIERISGNNTERTTGFIGMYHEYFDKSNYIDYIIVRNYISPEPTFGSPYPEELDITAVEPFTLSSNTCLGPCSISAGVTWHNYGNNSVTFRPAVLIDGTTFAYATTDLTILSGQDGYAIIVTPTLSLGSHNICPYPN